MKKKELILELLLNALKKEIESYNYYLEASESSPYPETKSLLQQLAEEEKKHHQLLLREYLTLREMFIKSKKRSSYLTKKRVSYYIPAELPFKQISSFTEVDIAAITLPTEFMGGDYLETFPVLSQNEKLLSIGVLLCDIMGHGMHAAQLKGLVKSTFSDIIDSILPKYEEKTIPEISSLIYRLNQLLWEPCRKADSFITLFYCILNPSLKKLIYTSAGHNPPLLFSDKGKKHLPLSNTQLLIGILEKVKYSQTEVQIKSGDLLLLYSDGLIEATNKRGKEFGINRVIESILENYHLSSKRIIRNILQSLNDFLQSKPLKDDLSLVIAKMS